MQRQWFSSTRQRASLFLVLLVAVLDPIEMYLAEGGGHGVLPTGPRNVSWLQYASDFFLGAGLLDKGPQPDVPPGTLKKYNGEPVEKIFTPPGENSSRRVRKRDAGKK